MWAMYDTQSESKNNLLKSILVERKTSNYSHSRGIFPKMILSTYKKLTLIIVNFHVKFK